MDAHAIHNLHVHPRQRERGRLTVSTIVRTGAIAGLAGGIVMATWQTIVGAIAHEATAVAGTHQSFWTAVTSIPSVILGPSWFHGSFETGAVVVGLMAHMMNSIMLGILGVGLATSLLGKRPTIPQTVAFGMVFGVVLQLVIVDGLINGVLQSVHTLSTATPAWSWWVAHVMFGAIFGLVAATLLRRRTD
jgi:hypothetical protein